MSPIGRRAFDEVTIERRWVLRRYCARCQAALIICETIIESLSSERRAFSRRPRPLD
jgi:hypothetical protein